MSTDDLVTIAREAPWCSAFGAGEVPGAVHIESLEQWQALIRECVAGEFDLPVTTPTSIPDFTWLSEDVESELPRSSSALEIRKLVFLSTKDVTSPWFRVDGTDLAPGFRHAAGHVFESAAAECEAGRPGIWTHAVDLYARGRWPFGITSSGQLLVL